MSPSLRLAAAALLLAAGLAVAPAGAQSNDAYVPPPSGDTYGQPGGTDAAPPPAPGENNTYTSEELIREGHSFFGGVSQGLASVIERAVSEYGLPNGYILGQEGSGAFIAGLRYGEGNLFTRNAGQHKVYW